MTAAGRSKPGAHFYRSYQLDGEGNPINKRNAWQTRSVLYVRLIPPGAADVAHYRVHIPKDAKGPDHASGEAELPQVLALLHAVRLCGRAQPGQDPLSSAPAFDNRDVQLSIRRTFRRTCPGEIKGEIPDLPIVTVAESQASRTRRLGEAATGRPPVQQAGSRALERLGHRPAAARRPERRGVRVQEGDRSRARIRRRLAECRARADPGRRNRCRQAVSSKRPWRSTASSAASTSSRRMIEKADGDYDARAAIPADGRWRCIRAIASC